MSVSRKAYDSKGIGLASLLTLLFQYYHHRSPLFQHKANSTKIRHEDRGMASPDTPHQEPIQW